MLKDLARPCVLITETLGLRSGEAKIKDRLCRVLTRWGDIIWMNRFFTDAKTLQSMHREFNPNCSRCALFQPVHSHLERLCRCTDANRWILTSLLPCRLWISDGRSATSDKGPDTFFQNVFCNSVYVVCRWSSWWRFWVSQRTTCSVLAYKVRKWPVTIQHGGWWEYPCSSLFLVARILCSLICLMNLQLPTKYMQKRIAPLTSWALWTYLSIYVLFAVLYK